MVRDTIGFAACKMIRRVGGIAHVEDFEAIADADVRAACERRVLAFGRTLLSEAGRFTTMRDVAAAAQALP